MAIQIPVAMHIPTWYGHHKRKYIAYNVYQTTMFFLYRPYRGEIIRVDHFLSNALQAVLPKPEYAIIKSITHTTCPGEDSHPQPEILVEAYLDREDTSRELDRINDALANMWGTPTEKHCYK